MKFILTSELNKLAKKLRFLGYNSTVSRSLSSHTTIRIAIKEERILLTRSVKLAKDKRCFTRILLVDDEPADQLRYLFHELKLNHDNIFTRCPDCNSELQNIPVEKVGITLPAKVLANYSEFKVCRKCGKYYWKGTHYEKTLALAQDYMKS
ncbi:MAG: hypothetical protein JXR56_03210 [Candidatus Cloacimonetes bacterium]|nr:hypothetical protein [Candidatus Cloacimonadota bacterium]